MEWKVMVIACYERIPQVLEEVQGGLKVADLDIQFFPPVGVRLVSIIADCHQHAGEALYTRGLP